MYTIHGVQGCGISEILERPLSKVYLYTKAAPSTKTVPRLQGET